ncbi:MAG: exodeoxyribonuclease VII small subunit [Bacilli bacterium]
MATKKDLTKLSYQELEKESEVIIQSLSKDDLSLDEASKIYFYGKEVSAEMEKRLAELTKKVSDTVSNI